MNSLSRMRERARARVGNSTKTPHPNPFPINGARELLEFLFSLDSNARRRESRLFVSKPMYRDMTVIRK